MEYQMIVAGDGNRMDELVNQIISEGWEPFGGCSVALSYDPEDHRHYSEYAQAMVRRGTGEDATATLEVDGQGTKRFLEGLGVLTVDSIKGRHNRDLNKAIR